MLQTAQLAHLAPSGAVSPGRAVASLAGLRCRFIKQDRLPFHLPRQLVAAVAPDIPMRTLKRERGPLLMVEQRWPPAIAVMALGAGCNAVFRKLLAMNVLVAVLAAGGRLPKIDMGQRGFHVRRTVAIDARGRSMGSEQRKRRLTVIKLRQLFPRLRAMTGFAACCLYAGVHPQHALLELAAMWIRMATGAIKAVPVIYGRRWLELIGETVAVGARHRDVASG